MRFINYCVIAMKETKAIMEEIKRISETVPNSLDAKGILIATFTSAIEPKELNDWFITNGFNFVFFELNPDSSGFNFIDSKIHEGLFGFLNDSLVDKETKFLDIVLNMEEVKVEHNIRKIRVSEEEINSMTEDEKKILCDELLDSGIENLSENDKKILQLLVK